MLLVSKFHLPGILYIDRMQIPVQIDDNSYGYRRFRRGNGNNKQSKEYTLQFFGIQIFIKSDKIDVHTIQDQLHRHQHCDHIPPGQQTIHPDKKKPGTDEKDMR
jgi:hypothetical protein